MTSEQQLGGRIARPSEQRSRRGPTRRGRSLARPTDRRQAVGALGERIAARWLRARGWTVLVERFRSGHRDLDLVVRQGSLVAFVEVKTRCGATFGDPAESVHWRKQRELVRSAQVWIDRHGTADQAYRFDVVGVLLLSAAARTGEEVGGSARVRGVAPTSSASPRGGPVAGAWRVLVRHVPDAFQVPVHA